MVVVLQRSAPIEARVAGRHIIRVILNLIIVSFRKQNITKNNSDNSQHFSRSFNTQYKSPITAGILN